MGKGGCIDHQKNPKNIMYVLYSLCNGSLHYYVLAIDKF